MSTEKVWVADRNWRVLKTRYGQGTCSFPRCQGSAVAVMRRWRRTFGLMGRTKVDSSYCADHLYGRRIVGDEVQIEVYAESPAAERGYVEAP